MAISFVAAGAVATGANPTVAVPTDTAAGDLLLLVTTGTAAPTAPTGWTLVSAQGAGQFITVYRKYATGSEASLVVTIVGAASKAVMLAYRGAGAYQVVPTYTTGSSTTATTPTLTTTYTNDYVISLVARTTGVSTFSVPTGTTSRTNSASTATINGLLVADELQASAGVSTARSSTLSLTGAWSAVGIAFIEARTVYWTGGAGTWDATTTTHWSNSTGITLTSASCSGTTLTTTGSPALTIGMQVFLATGATTLGTITGGSGNSWTVSVGGTAASQTMTAGIVNQVPPSPWDNVVIDVNSGTGSITATASSAACLNLTNTASQAIITAGTLSLIYGSLSLPTGGSATYTAATTFVSTTTGKTITTGGKSMPAVTFSGIGGGWTLSDTFTTTGVMTFTNGTFNTGNQTISSSNNITYTAGTACTINLGSSTISTSGFASVWNFGTTTNLTFNAGTSTIIFTIATNSPNFTSTGLTYNNVVFSAATTAGLTRTITGSNTFANLTFNAGSTAANTAIILTANQTITGTLTVSGGTPSARHFFQSSAVGTNRTITAAAVSLTDVDFQNITGAGTATWSGTRVGDATGNSGLIPDIPKTVYWNLAGAQNWSATGWAPSSGGTPAAANFPLPQDTAVFDNTGSVTGTITISIAYNYPTIDMSARTSAMTLSTGSTTFGIYGNLLLGSGVTVSSSGGSFNFQAQGLTRTITSNGRSFAGFIAVNAIGGTVQLADNFTSTSVQGASGNAPYPFQLLAGTLDLNNKTFTSNGLRMDSTLTRVLAFGATGNIVITGSGNYVFSNSPYTLFSYTGTPSPIVYNYSGSTGTRIINSAATGATISNSLSHNITAGSDSFQFYASGTGSALDLTFGAGFTGTWANSTQALTVFGTLTLSSGMTVGAGTGAVTFAPPVSTTVPIVSKTKTLDFPVIVNGAGAVQLGQDLTIGATRTFTITNGTFDANGYNVSVGLVALGAGTKALTMGSGTWTLTGTGAVWTLNTNATGLTFSGASAPIVLSDTSTTSRTFAGNGYVYNKLTIGGTTGSSTLLMTGVNTFSELASTKTVAHTIQFANNQVVNTWSATGTAGNYLTLNSNIGGTLRTITVNNPTTGIDYLDVTDIQSNTLPITFYAGPNTRLRSNAIGVAAIALTPNQYIHLILTGTTFNTPSNWNNANNEIHLFGGGGGGATSFYSAPNGFGGGGGGGGGYTKLTNVTLSGAIPCTVGTGGGAGGAGGTTTVNTIYTAGGGLAGSSATGGAGGVGLTYNGGTGGNGSTSSVALTGNGGGGGGGAGGPLGNGAIGGNGFASTTAANVAGGGGGGNGGGSAGGNASSATGGTGGNNNAGVGGGASLTAGFNGGGGGGGVNATTGGTGGSGVDIAAAGIGGGAGKGGGAAINPSGTPGTFGGGGGGAGLSTSNTNFSGGVGAQGGIVLIYTTSVGPVIFNGDVTENSSIVDILTALGIYQYSIIENSVINDNENATWVTSSNITEDSILADSEDVYQTFNPDITEDSSIAETELVQANFNSDTTENSTFADIESVQTNFNSSATEDSNIIDVEFTSWVTSSTTTEPVTVNDSISANFIFVVSITEPSILNDLKSVILSIASAITESLTSADSLSAQNVYLVSLVETQTSEDSQTVVAIFSAVDTENLASADIASTQVNFNAADVEGVTILDAESVQAVFAGTTTEPSTLADSQVTFKLLNPSITESLTSADSSTRYVLFSSDVSEGTTAADIVSAQAIFASFISENMISFEQSVGYGWFDVVDSQTIVWNGVNNTQSATWTDINNSQSNAWNSVDNTQTITWVNIGTEETPNWVQINNAQP